jgi:ABC-type lipoprotein export system ATPase subunit
MQNHTHPAFAILPRHYLIGITVKIISIQITKLFEIFDYDISFENNENIFIVTGPNGFGKTMILNIIDSLFNRKFSFFQVLIFEKIVLKLNENKSIEIIKELINENLILHFKFYDGETMVDEFSMPGKKSSPELGLYPTQPGLFDSYFAKEVASCHAYRQWPMRRSHWENNSILKSIVVHLIREQRLFKKVNFDDDGLMPRVKNKNKPIIIETIHTYAKELIKSIADIDGDLTTKSQSLDSSYPLRLRNEKNILSKEEYEERYYIIKEKQRKLAEFGLYENKQDFLEFIDEDAKALTVYLKDIESKLSIFDVLLKKLDLFTTILNERRFTFKSIHISRDKGFFFKTSTGKDLALEQLSSGEQHEVVLLYELIFNVKENVLVLIDEPEISLHITWQKEFLNDLLRIVQLQNIQVLIATHSPAIINGRWDLVYNLEKADA